MKLESYLMREAFRQGDWDAATRILCRAVGLAEEAVLELVKKPFVDDARGPDESISIIIGGTYAYWDSSEGFGLISFQKNVQGPSIRIYRREAD